MRKLIIAAAATFAFAGLAACENAAEKEAGAQADALNNQADAVQETADEKADAVEARAGNMDGGMTTSNTPAQ